MRSFVTCLVFMAGLVIGVAGILISVYADNVINYLGKT